MRELIPIAIILVGGVLLFPLIVSSAVRRLRQTPRADPARDAQLAKLEAELQQARDELNRLSERQQFIEALLEKRSPTALPR